MWRAIGNVNLIPTKFNSSLTEGGEETVFAASLFDDSWSRQSGQSRLYLLVIDYSTIFAYWEIDSYRRNILCQHFQQDWLSLPLFLRLHDVTDLIFDGHNARTIYQTKIGSTTDNWYIHGIQADRRFLADIVTTTFPGKPFSVLRSNVVATPAEHGDQHALRPVKFASVWTLGQTHRQEKIESQLKMGIDNSAHPHHCVLPYHEEFDGYSVHERG